MVFGVPVERMSIVQEIPNRADTATQSAPVVYAAFTDWQEASEGMYLVK